MVQEISRIIHKSRAKKQTCKRPVLMKDSQPSLGCDQSTQPLPQFRKPTASPYLGGPVSCESVRWCRAAGPTAERFPERWRAGAACSHQHTRIPFSSRTATCRSPRSADSEYPSRSCANTWKGAAREEEERDEWQLEIQTPESFSFGTSRHIQACSQKGMLSLPRSVREITAVCSLLRHPIESSVLISLNRKSTQSSILQWVGTRFRGQCLLQQEM